MIFDALLATIHDLVVGLMAVLFIAALVLLFVGVYLDHKDRQRRRRRHQVRHEARRRLKALRDRPLYRVSGGGRRGPAPEPHMGKERLGL